MKEFKTRKKVYLIDERGVVYDKQTMEPTRDIKIINEHYFLAGKPLHRIVYELYKGSILKGHCIHHQNTCPRDNRPQNLVSLSPRQHYEAHAKLEQNLELKKEVRSKAVQFFYREYGAEVKYQKRSQIITGKSIRKRHIKDSPRKRKKTYSVRGNVDFKYPFTEKDLKLIDAINKKLGFK